MEFIEQPHYVFNFDGAGTPTTPGGWGWVLYDDAANELTSACGSMPEGATSNEAEYTAVTDALRAAAQMYEAARDANEALPRFTIRGDSQLVINQLSGAWGVREPRLQVLHAEAHALLFALRGGWGLEWVRREQNQRADELSKKGRILASVSDDE